jgi:hypothetical protein
MMRWVTLWLSFVFGVSLPMTTVSPVPERITVDQQIEQWVSELSQEEQFHDWNQAQWVKTPLGPRPNVWYIQIKDERSIKGYLVVALANEHWRLLEYGLGELPLYAPSFEPTGNRHSVKERLYMDALHSVWRVTENKTNRYIDAKTGTILPIDDQDVKSQSTVPVHYTKASGMLSPLPFSIHTLHDVVDPYMNITWLNVTSSNVKNWNDFKKILNDRKGKLVYEAVLWNGRLMTPLGVAGYHWWTTKYPTPHLMQFVAIEQEGLRYIPLEQLILTGTFH